MTLGRLLVSGMGGASGYAVGLLARDLGFDPLWGDTDPQTPALLLEPSRAVLLPHAKDPDFLDAFDEVCRRHDITCMSPNVDAEIARLGCAAAATVRERVRVWLPADDIVACCLDKQRFAEFLEARVPELAPRRFGSDGEFPSAGVVVKPRTGSGGRGVEVCRTPEEMRRALRACPDALVQEHLVGPEFSADCVSDADGPSLVHLRLRHRTRAGMSTVTEAFTDADLEKAIMRVLGDLRFAGPSCVQGFLTPEGPRLTEVNVRFGGGCALSQFSGGGLVQTYLRALVSGEPLPAENFRYAAGAKLVRPLDFQYIPEELS